TGTPPMQQSMIDVSRSKRDHLQCFSCRSNRGEYSFSDRQHRLGRCNDLWMVTRHLEAVVAALAGFPSTVRCSHDRECAEQDPFSFGDTKELERELSPFPGVRIRFNRPVTSFRFRQRERVTLV